MNIEQAVNQLENMKMLKGYDNTTVNGRPLGNVIDDVIGLLKSYEPRIVSFDEVKAANDERCRYGLYTEVREDRAGVWYVRLFPGIILSRDDELYISDGMCIDYPVDEYNYGKEIRCWSACPSDEQCDEADWE